MNTSSYSYAHSSSQLAVEIVHHGHTARITVRGNADVSSQTSLGRALGTVDLTVTRRVELALGAVVTLRRGDGVRDRRLRG